jgi:LPS sulfotransferase NodH
MQNAGRLRHQQPNRLTIKRNRISDIFATGYLDSDKSIQNIKNYIILFTPRSGSSWLTELITDRTILGRPSEWFNPDLMQSAMNGFYRKSENIYEYCSALQDRHKSAEGIFGAELTAKHLSLLTSSLI